MSLSRSQRALRVVIATSSVGLALVTALATPMGTIVGAGVLIILTPFVALDPPSRLTTLLLGLHAVNWLTSNTVPTQTRDWMLTLVAAAVLLTIHLAAALAASLPDAAPLPRATLKRWLRRGLTVIGLSVPVWAFLIANSAAAAPAATLTTYAAVASLAILALAFWLAQNQTRPPSTTQAEPNAPRG